MTYGIAAAPSKGWLDAPYGLGRFLANVPLLIRQPQNLPRLRHDSQTVVLQEATSVAIANRPGSFESGMAGEIHLRGIVQNQHQRLLGHRGSRLQPMGLLNDRQSGRLLVANAVEGTDFIPVKNLVERLLGMSRDFRSGVDQAFGPPPIVEIHGPEVFCAQSKQEESSMRQPHLSVSDIDYKT
jgi:hypothetical protein